MVNKMRVIMYGNTEPIYPLYLQKPLANYSNGTASQFRTLTTKQFEKESKKHNLANQIRLPTMNIEVGVNIEVE